MACNDGSDSTGSAGFPSSLALGSPTDVVTEGAAVALNGAPPASLLAWLGGLLVPKAHAASGKVARYTWATLKINELLNGSVLPAGVFVPQKFLVQESDAQCFGPNLQYTAHPDTTSGSSNYNGQMPAGDLGIWLEGDTATGHACAAAQLTARMEGVSWRGNMALMGLAAMVGEMNRSGVAIPTAGSRADVTVAMNAMGLTDVTFNQATLSLDASGTVWTYVMDFVYTDSGGKAHGIIVKLEHVTGATSSQYQGLLTYAVQDQFNGGNCPGTGLRDVTTIGTLKYTRNGLSDMRLSHRSGRYCGNGSYTTLAGFQSDGQLDPADTWNLGTATGWADSFSRIGADYDPTTLAGSYFYGWQAGYMDSHSRVFEVRLDGGPVSGSSSGAGEAWYGYGDSIDSATISIQGFFCNWTAIGGTKTLQPMAQRQALVYDSVTEKWTQPTGDSDILYAPTDSCTYAGGGGFWYDRNLNGLVDEGASDIDVAAADLMDKGSYASLEARIQATGYSKPAF